MKIYLGETGLNETFQEPFTQTVECCKCKGEARIMFVGVEDKEKKYISDLRTNSCKGDYWVHDAIAIAVYLCRDCFEVTAKLNQA